MLMVSPIAPSTASELSTDSGMETSTTRVLRHEPRKSRIISPVSPAAMAASRMTSTMAPETNTDWSNSAAIFMSFGAAAWMPGSIVRTRLTTDNVEELPFLRISSSTER